MDSVIFPLRRLCFSTATPQFTKSAPPLSLTALAFASAATKKVRPAPGPWELTGRPGSGSAAERFGAGHDLNGVFRFVFVLRFVLFRLFSRASLPKRKTKRSPKSCKTAFRSGPAGKASCRPEASTTRRATRTSSRASGRWRTARPTVGTPTLNRSWS